MTPERYRQLETRWAPTKDLIFGRQVILTVSFQELNATDENLHLEDRYDKLNQC